MIRNKNYGRWMIIGLILFLGLGATTTSQVLRGGSGSLNQKPVSRSANGLDAQSSGQGQTRPQDSKGEAKRAEEESLIKVNSEVVTVTVTVTDDYDRPVTGLRREHFEVFDDKVKQEVEYFSGEDAPISIGILFDVSGSMRTKLERARKALRAFVQTSHDNDDFFLAGFNQSVRLLADFCDGNALVNKLSMADPRGGTALYDAVYLGTRKVKEGRHAKRALLVISDGQDNSSRFSYRDVRQLIKEAHVMIYCLGIVEEGVGENSYFDLQGKAILGEIAQSTGGKAFFPHSGDELEDATTRIALELRHQYSLGYIPTNLQRDGKWHKIAVRISPPRGMPKLFVRAKEGYYAVPPK